MLYTVEVLLDDMRGDDGTENKIVMVTSIKDTAIDRASAINLERKGDKYYYGVSVYEWYESDKFRMILDL